MPNPRAGEAQGPGREEGGRLRRSGAVPGPSACWRERPPVLRSGWGRGVLRDGEARHQILERLAVTASSWDWSDMCWIWALSSSAAGETSSVEALFSADPAVIELIAATALFGRADHPLGRGGARR